MSDTSTPSQGTRDQAHWDAVLTMRTAWIELLGAERRLRGRDQHHPDRLSHSQLRALVVLSDGPKTAGQLAKSADVNPASVTPMLDHLEQQGVVIRRRDDRDRRRCIVELTAAGRRLIADKRDRWDALWRERLGEIDKHDLATTTTVMRIIGEILDELTPTAES